MKHDCFVCIRKRPGVENSNDFTSQGENLQSSSAIQNNQPSFVYWHQIFKYLIWKKIFNYLVFYDKFAKKKN